MTRAHPLAAATLLTTCLSGQACTPVVYELASAGESGPTTKTSETDPPVDPTTGDTTDSTVPSDPTLPPPSDTSESGTSEPPAACDDGMLNGGETDLDCGGPCKPCHPGQACEDPRDCDLGLCFDNMCGKPGCFGPEDCPPPGPCSIGVCDPGGQCVAKPDFDGTACEDGDLCLGGKCLPTEKLDCSKLDGPCRTGLCNPQTGDCVVEWPNEGEACKDELECTFGELCSLGECVAPPAPPPLLFTDFSLLGGWTAEPPWQIGPAAASACSDKQAEDPDTDHSPSADDHVAGAAIGGCLSVDAFPEACLVSPVLDVFVPGELWLHYFAILHTADAPMQSSVEVFDSKTKTWIALVVIDQFVAEPDWTEHTHDLTPFKGPELRVRFCHRSSGPTISIAGWSIDDLVIGPPACAP
jgi:hypothetical protein